MNNNKFIKQQYHIIYFKAVYLVLPAIIFCIFLLPSILFFAKQNHW